MHQLSPDIAVHQEIDGSRYVLPRRRLGKARWGGVLLMAFGAGTTAFMVFWILSVLGITGSGDNPPEAFRWFGFVMALMGLPGLAITLGIFGLGLLIVLNVFHSEVAIRRGQIISTERVGPFWWSRRRKLKNVSKLVVEPSFALIETRRTSADATYLPARDTFTIRADGDAIDKPMLIAPGYRQALLLPLADELAAAIGVKRPAGLDGAQRPDVEVRDSDTGKAETEATEETVPDQPADSDAVCELRPDGLSITIPPAGVRKGSKGLIGGAIVWNAIVVGISVFFLLFQLGIIESKDGGDAPWFAWLILGLFLAIGVWMLLAAINMGRRRAILDVVTDTLLLTRASMFQTRQAEFRADELKGIRVGHSGMSINDVPVQELQIYPITGKKVGLLSQRDDDELKWIAAHLRQALNVGRG